MDYIFVTLRIGTQLGALRPFGIAYLWSHHFTVIWSYRIVSLHHIPLGSLTRLSGDQRDIHGGLQHRHH